MGAKWWTQEETSYLIENAGDVKLKKIASTLGKSYETVKIKAHRLGISVLYYDGYLTFKDIEELFMLSSGTLSRVWKQRGLKYRNPRGKYGFSVECKELIKFLGGNLDLFSTLYCEDLSFIMDAPWYEEKRKSDLETMYKYGGQFKRWSDNEVSRLKSMYEIGVPHKKIASNLGRSLSSVERKLSRVRRGEI